MPFPNNTPNGQSLLSRLNTRLRSNPVWMQLFTAVSRVIEQRVAQPRSQLGTIRSPYVFNRGDWVTVPSPDGEGPRAIINSIRQGGGVNGSDRVYAQLAGSSAGIEFDIGSNLKEKSVQVAGCRLHGFNYFADTLDQKDYARIHEWVEQYWPESGTPQFARFIGFIKGMNLNVHQLWSDEVPRDQDYYPYLERSPRGKPIYEGGLSYPTSHVDLSYDAILDTNIDMVDLFYLFYYLAPIHLVLERIVADVTIPPINVYKSVIVAPIKLIEKGVLNTQFVAPSRKLVILSTAPIKMFTSGRLNLLPKTASLVTTLAPAGVAGSAKSLAKGSSTFTTAPAVVAAGYPIIHGTVNITLGAASAVATGKALATASVTTTVGPTSIETFGYSLSKRGSPGSAPMATTPLG